MTPHLSKEVVASIPTLIHLSLKRLLLFTPELLSWLARDLRCFGLESWKHDQPKQNQSEHWTVCKTKTAECK